MQETEVVCGCGNEFTTYSTREEMVVEICSECHPFYTGEQRYVDSAGRVEKFQEKYDWGEERIQEMVGEDISSESEENQEEESESS